VSHRFTSNPLSDATRNRSLPAAQEKISGAAETAGTSDPNISAAIRLAAKRRGAWVSGWFFLGFMAIRI